MRYIIVLHLWIFLISEVGSNLVQALEHFQHWLNMDRALKLFIEIKRIYTLLDHSTVCSLQVILKEQLEYQEKNVMI